MSTQFTIVFEFGDEGLYTAYIPEIPGAISQGTTKEEARENVLSAMEEILEVRRELALLKRGATSTIEVLNLSA